MHNAVMTLTWLLSLQQPQASAAATPLASLDMDFIGNLTNYNRHVHICQWLYYAGNPLATLALVTERLACARS